MSDSKHWPQHPVEVGYNDQSVDSTAQNTNTDVAACPVTEFPVTIEMARAGQEKTFKDQDIWFIPHDVLSNIYRAMRALEPLSSGTLATEGGGVISNNYLRDLQRWAAERHRLVPYLDKVMNLVEWSEKERDAALARAEAAEKERDDFRSALCTTVGKLMAAEQRLSEDCVDWLAINRAFGES